MSHRIVQSSSTSSAWSHHAAYELQRGDLVHVVSRALLEAGDCVPLALEA